MHPSCRCRTAVHSGCDHDLVPFHAALLTDPWHILFADSAPHGRLLWAFGAGANGGVGCYLAY